MDLTKDVSDVSAGKGSDPYAQKISLGPMGNLLIWNSGTPEKPRIDAVWGHQRRHHNLLTNATVEEAFTNLRVLADNLMKAANNIPQKG